MPQNLNPLGVDAYSIWPNPTPITKPSPIHQHTNIEIMVFEHGATTMFYGGRTVRISPDRMAIFWGAMPHQALKSAPHRGPARRVGPQRIPVVPASRQPRHASAVPEVAPGIRHLHLEFAPWQETSPDYDNNAKSYGP